VTVQDLNDTPPKFSRNLYTESVSEGITTGTKVATITVTDEDSTGQLNLIIKTGSEICKKITKIYQRIKIK
jgi:hypothetical protein